MMRSRPRHALANDAALAEATVTAIAVDGWNATTMASISQHAELTYGAAYGRYDDKRALALTVWRERLADLLPQALMTADAALATGPAAFANAMSAFASPAPGLVAAVELVQAGAFDPRLRTDVYDPIAHWLDGWIHEDSTGAVSTVRATLAYLGIGLVLASWRSWPVDLSGEFARYHRGLTEPAPSVPLPADQAIHLSLSPFDTGDERIDRAMEATMAVVGELGYHQATVNRICRASGVSAGFLYKRYAGKLDIFLAATDALLRNGLQANADYTAALIDQYGPAIAEAVTWREVQRPYLSGKRTIALESNRLARYDQRMHDVHQAREDAFFASLPRGAQQPRALAHAYGEVSLGLGMHLVANLAPRTWELPFDQVTVPLLASLAPE
ncbi:MAG: TetR/AcrR family transcriptional regulator [Actinomycetales bacterium]|nr:TetR/AcrR family transcriptional regulator [Actinomycetales bacterium]